MWAGGDVLLQQDSDQLLPSPSLGTSQPGPPWAAAHVLLPPRREVRQRERQVLESAGPDQDGDVMFPLSPTAVLTRGSRYP